MSRAKSKTITKGRRTTLAKHIAEIDALPFVGSLGRGQGWNYWAAKPTGDYTADCKQGRAFAEAFIPLLRTSGGVSLVPAITRGMINANDQSGLVIGFMNRLGEQAALWHWVCSIPKMSKSQATKLLARLEQSHAKPVQS